MQQSPAAKDVVTTVEDIGEDIDCNDSVDGNSYMQRRQQKVDELSYETNHRKRGRFVIINNKTFEAVTKLCERTGSDVDATNLESVARDVLGFEVEVRNNLTGTEMIQVMIAEARQDHSECDCFGVAVLTHGEDGKLYGTDGLLAIDSFVTPIKNCLSLAGKPKLFFFQACRGDRFDEGVTTMVTDESDSIDGEAANVQSIQTQTEILLPLDADFLYAYSTVPGYFSWRNGVQGSWFVQALTNQLRNVSSSSADIDLVRMLTRVNHQVAYEFESKSNDPAYAEKKQVPSIVSMLTKDFYFTKK